MSTEDRPALLRCCDVADMAEHSQQYRGAVVRAAELLLPGAVNRFCCRAQSAANASAQRAAGPPAIIDARSQTANIRCGSTLCGVAQAGYSSTARAVICLVMQTVGLVRNSVVRSRPGADLVAEQPGPIRRIPEV